MQQWEYCRLTFTGSEAHVQTYTPHGPITAAVADVAATVARLGEEGWELVATDAFFEATEGATYQILSFKRPISPDVQRYPSSRTTP